MASEASHPMASPEAAAAARGQIVLWIAEAGAAEEHGELAAGHELRIVSGNSPDLRTFAAPELVMIEVPDIPEASRARVRRVREAAATSDLPILLLAGPGREISCMEGLKAGADDYLMMPANHEAVGLKINQLRRRNSDRRADRVVGRPAGSSAVGSDEGVGRLAERHLQDLAESAPVALFTKDLSGRYTLANGLANVVLGKKEGVVGLTDHDLLPKETADSLQQHDQEALAARVPLQREELINGRKFLSSKFPMLDAGGKPVGVCGVALDITERSRIEQLLRDSEEKFRTLTEHAPVGIFMSDSSGESLFVNGQWCRMAGMPAKDAAGKGWMEALHPDDRERVTEAWGRARATGEPSEAQYRFLHPDGTIVWVQGRANPITDAKGHITGYIGSCVDITKRRHQEEALLESEQRFGAIVRQAAAGVLQVDIHGKFRFFNECWCDMLGYTAEEMLELSLEDVAHPDSREATLAQVRSLLQGGPDFIIEKKYKRKDGSPLWALSNFSALRDERDEVKWIVALVMDTTARKRTEEELATMTAASDRQRRLYDAILSNIPDLIYVFDRERRFIYANEALLTIWGKSAEEGLGKTCAELDYEPWQTEMLERDIDQVVETRKIVRGEMAYHGTAGNRIYDYILTPVTGSDGEVEYVAGTTRDVTVRKRAEQQASLLSLLSQQLGSIPEEPEILKTATEALGHFLDTDCCYFAESPPNGKQMQINTLWAKDCRTRLEAFHNLPGLAGRDWREKSPADLFAVSDTERHPLTRDYASSYRDLKIRSCACRPYQSDDNSLVLICVTAETPREWREDELTLLQEVVDRVWPQVERARSEAMLRDNRQRLRLVSDQIPALVCHVGCDLTIDFANARHEEWFGLSEAQATGKNLREVLGKPLVIERWHYFEKALAGETARFEGPAQHRTLGRRELEFSLVPDTDAAGKTRGIFLMAFDITDRKRSEITLKRQGTRLRLLWEAAKIILTADDPDTMLQRLFARIREHIEVDLYFNFMVDESDNELHLRSCEGIPQDEVNLLSRISFGESICGTVALKHEQIQATHIQDSEDPKVQLVKGYGVRCYACNPLMTGQEFLGTLSFASRTRDEFSPDELEFMQTISHHVTSAYERHRLISNLRESDRRKDQFLATLAHELRNPLAPILTGLEVMLRSIDNPEAITRVAAMMQRQTLQIVHLIDDLLDISRITTGKIILKNSRESLDGIIRSAVEAAQPLIEKFHHVLEVDQPEDDIEIEGDPHRLAQIVSNLLSNAAKYTPSGGRIILEAKMVLPSSLSLVVRDNGLGIDPHSQKKIFNLFEQDDHGRNDGLGIGLTLVKSLVEMHGGTVTVRSEGAGTGSEFSVTLPNCSRRGLPDKPLSPAENGAPAGPKRVLVVDDGKSAADILALFFRLEGLEVEVAYDGQEALDLVDVFVPDLVVMDLGMPRVDGFEAARRMRADHPELILIALSGWGRDEDKQRSAEAGFDCHLIKPVSPSDLRQMLKSFGAVPSSLDG